MFAFVLRRFLLTVPVVWIVVTLVFGLIHLVPGDPVAQMLGEGASVTEVERLRHELGLDRPILEQYRDIHDRVCCAATSAIRSAIRNPWPLDPGRAIPRQSSLRLRRRFCRFSSLCRSASWARFAADVRRSLREPCQPAWCVAAEFRLGAAADSAVCRSRWVAAGFRPRRFFASDLARGDAGRRACGVDDANGARFDAGGDPAGLRSHCAREGPQRTGCSFPARAAKRADSRDHGASGFRRERCWRARSSRRRFFRGRAGTTDGPGNQCARLSAVQGCILTIALTYILINLVTDVSIPSWIPASAMNEFFRKNKLALAGFLIVIALDACGDVAPWLAPYDPAAQTIAGRLEGPSWNHPFGNDELGRDILSRILLGARVSMRVGATVVLFSV